MEPRRGTKERERESREGNGDGRRCDGYTCNGSTCIAHFRSIPIRLRSVPVSVRARRVLSCRLPRIGYTRDLYNYLVNNFIVKRHSRAGTSLDFLQKVSLILFR